MTVGDGGFEGSTTRSSGPVTIDEVLRPSSHRDLRRLPGLVRQAFVLTWQAAPREFVLASSLQVAGALALAGQLFVAKRLLDKISAADGVPDVVDLAPQLATLGVLLLIVTVTSLVQREQQRVLGELVQKHTTGHVLGVSTAVDLITFEEPSFYDRLQRARVNASVRPLQIANGIIGLLGSATAVTAVAAALMWAEPIVGAIVVLGGLPSIYVNRRMSKILHAHTVRQTPSDRRRAYLYDTLSRREGAHEVRAFDSGDYLHAEHDRLYDAKVDDLRTTVRRRLLLGTVGSAIAAVVTVAALGLLLYFLNVGRIDIGDAALAVGAVILLAGKLRSFTTSAGALYEGALFLSDFTDFVASHRPSSGSPSARSASTLSPFECIELEHVSFTYPSRTEPSLIDISCSIRAGEVVALVGENGSGKTTLTKILAGLYRPTEGAVRWDGIDTATLDLAQIRDQAAVIFQDFVRYFLTASENIAISRMDEAGRRDAIEQAALRAGAHGFLSALPAGYDTLLGPSFIGGSDISGGQWQRIALARAYFRNSPMLILDEPTAALDPRGEYEIFQQVRRLAEGHTVILVSHRFSNVRAADRILVLEQGRIVEEGTHPELMVRGGLYAELFNLQADGYRRGT